MTTSNLPTTTDGAWWADKPDATLQQYISTLDSGQHWASSAGTTTITYNIMNQVPNSGELTEAAGFTAFNSTQRAAVPVALQSWSDVANVRFVETSGLANINLGASSTTQGGGTYTRKWISGPTTIARANIWLSTSWASNQQMDPGQYGLTVLIHELGHALGVNHSGNYDAINGQPIEAGRLYGNDDRQHSIMSYFQSPAYLNQHLYPSSPMLMDIATIQAMYGANTTTRTGNDTYVWTDKASFISAIWDAGGTDTINAGNQTLRSIIDLNPGSFSSIGAMPDGSGPAINNLAVAYGVTLENAIGGSGNDTLLGNSVANVLTGGAGDNLFNGRGGNDTLIGGSGTNSYLFEGEWGQDTLIAPSGNNLLTFRDVDRSQLQFSRSADNLIIQGKGSSNQVTVNGYYAAGYSSVLADSAGPFTFSLVTTTAAVSITGASLSVTPVATSGMVASSRTGEKTTGTGSPVILSAIPVSTQNRVSGSDPGDPLILSALAVNHTRRGTSNPEALDAALVTVRDRSGGNGLHDPAAPTMATGQPLATRLAGLRASAILSRDNNQDTPFTVTANAGNHAGQTHRGLALGNDYVGVEGYADKADYSLNFSGDSGHSPDHGLGFHAPLHPLTYRDGTGPGINTFAMVEDPGMSRAPMLGTLVGKS
ncbi:MAG: M10 family metallopeptidase C-terminal domain-containing protein [Magnetococcales bacterium]|nr:M10 family metallopeptidase C-terminal domain-containing protein [Magnetococcales bacterium]